MRPAAASGELQVGIGDLGVLDGGRGIVATHSLGSCVGVVMHDSARGVGAILHFQLPESRINPERARTQPALFCDSGLELLVSEMSAHGGNPKRSRIYVAGGAQMIVEMKTAEIGKRNCLAVRKALWRMGLPVQAEHVGGSFSRTLKLDLATGVVRVILGNREVVEL